MIVIIPEQYLHDCEIKRQVGRYKDLVSPASVNLYGKKMGVGHEGASVHNYQFRVIYNTVSSL